ncbi:DUF1579 domain-containing protein [Aeoliella sp. SH292]|uniref:DUF1579 domain-containing protein n=1 Tax=Aeoliella sp. SH292 TaxID=3454464 RepID=UPI003F9A2E3C
MITRKQRTLLLALGLVATLAIPSVQAQDFPKPTKEHEWLAKFVGEWESSSNAPAMPGGEEMECSGTATYRMLGGFWVIGEMKGDAGGMNMDAVQTIGYDPEQKAYVGTWVDSITGLMWKYKGSVDKSGNKISLEAEGPNFMTGKGTAMFRDSYEFDGPDHIIARSEMQGEDGKWIEFMKGDMRRVKKD